MKHPKLPARRDTRITSQYIPKDGSLLIGVARGFTGGGEIMYRIEADVLAGAVEDKKELAVIVNNLGLLVLAQLTNFNLAESLEELPRAVAAWGHINATSPKKDDAVEALRIAQRTVHLQHGHQCGLDAPDIVKGELCECLCECSGTVAQTICAEWCDLCRAAQLSADADDGTRAVLDIAPCEDHAYNCPDGPECQSE